MFQDLKSAAYTKSTNDGFLKCEHVEDDLEIKMNSNWNSYTKVDYKGPAGCFCFLFFFYRTVVLA